MGGMKRVEGGETPSPQRIDEKNTAGEGAKGGKKGVSQSQYEE